MKNVAILGSTGSIGKQALDVVRSHPDRFALYGVSAHSSEEAFLALLRAARPRRQKRRKLKLRLTATSRSVCRSGVPPTSSVLSAS